MTHDWDAAERAWLIDHPKMADGSPREIRAAMLAGGALLHRRADLTLAELARLFSRTISALADAVRVCACGRGCPSNLSTCPACGRPDWCRR